MYYVRYPLIRMMVRFSVDCKKSIVFFIIFIT